MVLDIYAHHTYVSFRAFIVRARVVFPLVERPFISKYQKKNKNFCNYSINFFLRKHKKSECIQKFEYKKAFFSNYIYIKSFLSSSLKCPSKLFIENWFFLRNSIPLLIKSSLFELFISIFFWKTSLPVTDMYVDIYIEKARLFLDHNLLHFPHLSICVRLVK